MTTTYSHCQSFTRLFAWCLAGWWAMLCLPAFSLTLKATEDGVALTRELAAFVDTSNALGIEDLRSGRVRLQAHPEGVPNFGHSDASVWVGTTLHWPADEKETGHWAIELADPNLLRTDFYLRYSNGHEEIHRSGYRTPALEQSWPHRNSVAPVTLTPGMSVEVLINVERKGGAIQFPLRVWDTWSLLKSELQSNYLFGVCFGIMYAMLLYNLFLFVSMRLRSQFYYIAYLASMLVTFHALTGYGAVLLWPTFTEWSGEILIVASCLGVSLALQFLRAFVRTRQLSPLLDRLLLALAIPGPLLALVQLLRPGDIFSEATAAYSLLCSLVSALSAAYCIYRGSRQAIFFLLAWSCFLIGVTGYTAALIGMLPIVDITRHAMLIGAVVEVILLSLGLGDRYNTDRRERYKALAEQHETLLKLKETESRLMYRALHSGTTGLPNRNLMRECLHQLIEKDRSTETRFSLLLVSFRNFHEFNKTLGHQNGDAILKVLAERLNACVIKHADALCLEKTPAGAHYIAAVEGVMFGCVLVQPDQAVVRSFALRLLQELEAPFAFQSMSLQVDASIGISQYPGHGNTPDHLLRSAQIALELASNHPDQIMVYNPDEDPYSARRLTLLSDLRQAIEQNGLDLYLQPQVNLAGNDVSGAEVLIRWKHARHGFIPPDQFIPLAERTGVIQPLTAWVFQRAFTYLEELNRLGYRMTLSVNISARNLQDPEFRSKVIHAARQHHLEPSQIVMELTETAMMLNENNGTQVLYDLDSAGFGIAIDDFGTGYSSLAYLKRLPVREIKIDRTFIKDMAQQQDDKVIVTTTLQMGHNLGLRVVAEGIEDASTLDFLREAGCDLAQGYFIARPMPFTDFLTWLEQRQPQIQQAVTGT